MSAEADYLRAERDNILRTLELIADVLNKRARSPYETIALGKLLQDLYTGLERVVRARLVGEGIQVEKTESWHKDLLLAARENSIVDEGEFDAFGKLLLFRHVQVHGYGFMLEDARLVEIACSVTEICRGFLSRIEA